MERQTWAQDRGILTLIMLSALNDFRSVMQPLVLEMSFWAYLSTLDLSS